MLIKNIRIIDPASGTDAVGDILFQDGRIGKILIGEDSRCVSNVEAGDGGSVVSDGEAADDIDVSDAVIDGTGLVCVPGLVDAHVHFRDPGFTYKEDIETGARSAAAGGFTSVVMMANTKPAIDNEETLKYVLEKAAAQPIHVYTCADITMGLKGETLVDMKKMSELGAVGFTDDGIPLRDPDICMHAMEAAAELNMPLSFHEEDPNYITNNGINAGAASEHFGVGGSPREAEISMIRRDLEIAGGLCRRDGDGDTAGAVEVSVAGCPDIVIQHISTAEGVDLVRQARKTNPHIHAEATPHHFSLTEEAVIEHGAMAKMNPPLRTEADRRAIIEGLRDGTIELISTDHAPHSAEEKSRPVTEAPSGIIGLETSLALGITNLVCSGSAGSYEFGSSGALSLSELISKMTINPAKLYGLDAGRIYEGGPADLVIFDPDEEWIVPDTFESRSTNTPFIGAHLRGRVRMTICGGKVVFNR